MHSFLFRANALLTFATTILALLCGLASVAEKFHTAHPEVDIKLSKVEGFKRTEVGNDEVRLVLDVSADLRSVFTWNTKQLFVFVCAEYETDLNKINQVSLWDRIIVKKADAKFRLPFVRNKYKLVDQGNYLQGRSLNLTMYWNIMPITGAIRTGKKVFSKFVLPKEYTSSSIM
eukprot:TRINITY_DN1339_c0_g2_i1.p1 TRINITY_DN1339_c0_g2~~TRINITY_DN1339_c0_g2_i1.p1  ORF type:complete len:174 (+),score=30.72 TRINITY_DN1339_c0_g2_i1:213-734(+)